MDDLSPDIWLPSHARSSPSRSSWLRFLPLCQYDENSVELRSYAEGKTLRRTFPSTMEIAVAKRYTAQTWSAEVVHRGIDRYLQLIRSLESVA